MSNLRNYLRYILLKPFKSWKNKYLKAIIYKNKENCVLYKNTVKELSEYTKETLNIIEEKYRNPLAKDINWHKAEEQDLEFFYREDEHFLYELPLWNAERNRAEYLCRIIAPYLKRTNSEIILDYGAGAGDLAIALTRRGFKLIYADLNKELIDFARWRFIKNKLNIPVIDLMNRVKFPPVDCIVSFDVLEHLKNLPGKIAEIADSLSVGKSFIFSGAFSGGDAHLKENEVYDDFKNLDSVLKRFGFAFYDKFAQYYFYKKAPVAHLDRAGPS